MRDSIKRMSYGAKIDIIDEKDDDFIRMQTMKS